MDAVALQNISFTIEPGQKVALVGPSGAGKSTIAALLLGWMEPSAGGVQGRSNTDEIAWLPQNPYLFHDTIAANIRIARPNASMDEVVAAAKAAQAHGFIQKMGLGHFDSAQYQQTLTSTFIKENISIDPRASASDLSGYETIIGERGARLSGGQAQRIALARAFLMDAPFVILDEPTANLDPELETQIAQTLKLLLENRSALIIAHRLNTVRDADKIIVLDGGQIIQQGTYNELIAQDGLFQSMVNAADNRRPPTVENRLRSAVLQHRSGQPAVPSTQLKIGSRQQQPPLQTYPLASIFSLHALHSLACFLSCVLTWVGSHFPSHWAS